MSRVAAVLSLGVLLAAGNMSAALAAADPCSTFTWDVTRELAVMNQEPHVVSAAAKPAAEPAMKLGELYALKLVGQSAVTFLVKPGKPTLDDGAQAGMASVKVAQAGRYRVSITSGHWLDLVSGSTLVRSRDFQGQRGCARPKKIVEFDLDAGEYTLQLSGGPDETVFVSVTAAPAAAG